MRFIWYMQIRYKNRNPPSEKIHPNYTHYILRNLYIISVYTIYENTHICPPKAGLLETEQQYRKNSGKSSLLFRLKAEWKKQNAPPRGNCTYTLISATCHDGRRKWTTQLKIDYSRKKKQRRISNIKICFSHRYFSKQSQ